MDLLAMAPDACTLPTIERPTRLSEFDELFTDLVDAKRIDTRHGRLVFAARPRLAARARDLTRRETECCDFFDFAVLSGTDDRRDATVVLDIRVPDAYADVLTAFLAWAQDVRHGRRQGSR